MSVGQSSVNTSNYLTRSTNLPTSSGDFAISGWFYVSALPSSGNLGTIFSVSHASGWHWIGINSSGNVLVYDTVAVAFSPTIATVAAGDYVYVALGRSSAGNVVVGYASVNNGTSATQTVSSPTGGALTALRGLINGNGNTEGGAGYLDHVRVWNSIPTQAEVDSERTAATAVRTTDLLSDSPLPDTSTLNGWSITGTLSNGTDSPYVAGGGAQTLTPSLFTNTNTFYAPTVDLTFTAMFDDVVFDSAIFDTTAATGDQTLTAALFSNTNTFYAATVAPQAVTLTPGLFSNTNTFYAATVSLGGAAQDLTPGLYSNSNTFFAPTVSPGAVTLTPGLYSNAPAFYTPTVAPGAVTLTPARYDNPQTFYAPTVAAGAVTLTPARYDNSQTFYAPTVAPGAVSLTPARYDNSQTFYAATVAPGAVDLTPGLFSNTNAFYAAIVTADGGDQALLPGRYDNSQTFYAGTVTPGAVTITPSLASNTNTFFAAIVDPGAVTLTPALLSNTANFYAATVGVGEVTLSPNLVASTPTFYAATVAAGPVEVTPGLFSNTNTFYAATVASDSTQTLVADRFDNAAEFYPPTVVREGVTILEAELFDFGRYVEQGYVEEGYTDDHFFLPTVVRAPLTDAQKLAIIYKILANRQQLDPTTGTFRLYDDDDVTILYEVNAWEDAAGTIPYRGRGLRRLDALE